MDRMLTEQAPFVGDWGQGPAVVLLHGTPSDPGDFQPLVDALAGRHRVLVPHLPGYGKTPPEDPACSLDRLIARVEDRLIGSGISEAAVVAFSGGAYKAVAMALGGRFAVRRLALLAPVVGWDVPVAQSFRAMVAAVRAGAFDPRPTWLDRMASPGFGQRDPVGAARILAWLDRVPISVLCDELLAIADARDLRPRMPEIRCPVLVGAGTADNAVPASESKALAEAIPRGKFIPFDGAGHALLVEAPDRLVRVLGAFLAEE